jgi:hypothetical protein
LIRDTQLQIIIPKPKKKRKGVLAKERMSPSSCAASANKKPQAQEKKGLIA